MTDEPKSGHERLIEAQFAVERCTRAVRELNRRFDAEKANDAKNREDVLRMLEALKRRDAGG